MMPFSGLKRDIRVTGNKTENVQKEEKKECISGFIRCHYLCYCLYYPKYMSESDLI